MSTSSHDDYSFVHDHMMEIIKLIHVEASKRTKERGDRMVSSLINQSQAEIVAVVAVIGDMVLLEMRSEINKMFNQRRES